MFDVKKDFTCNTRLVKDGHCTPDPTTSSYAGAVSYESIGIAISYAALMKLDVMADIWYYAHEVGI